MRLKSPWSERTKGLSYVAVNFLFNAADTGIHLTLPPGDIILAHLLKSELIANPFNRVYFLLIAVFFFTQHECNEWAWTRLPEAPCPSDEPEASRHPLSLESVSERVLHRPPGPQTSVSSVCLGSRIFYRNSNYTLHWLANYCQIKSCSLRFAHTLLAGMFESFDPNPVSF